MWWRRSGSNRLPLECHSSALPSELHPQGTLIVYHRILQIASSFFFFAKIIKWQNAQMNCYFFSNIEYDLGDRKVTRFMHKSRHASRYCHSNPLFLTEEIHHYSIWNITVSIRFPCRFPQILSVR